MAHVLFNGKLYFPAPEVKESSCTGCAFYSDNPGACELHGDSCGERHTIYTEVLPRVVGGTLVCPVKERVPGECAGCAFDNDVECCSLAGYICTDGVIWEEVETD